VNIGGKFYTLAYGNPCGIHVDPIEKSLSTTSIRELLSSIATAGCNFRCLNCQNKGYDIAAFNVNDGRCKFCKTPIPGRWESA
jgi:pyruvate-formate lyase-activating enzyme